jgi:hypothetical protein
MRIFSLWLLALATMSSAAGAGEQDKVAQKTSEEIVRAGILQFHDRTRSADAQVREKAFDDVLPDKKLLETLFGDGANVIWPPLSEGMKRMRASMHKAKEESDRRGAVKSIELIDVRKEDVSGRYQRVLQVISKDIPVYRAVVRYEKGTAGSSSYLVVDGRMRLVRGLEEMPRFIEEQKKGKE